MDDHAYTHYTPPYIAKLEANVANAPGCWNSTRIGIYRGETKVGEYLRNYHSYGVSTFAPFRRGDQWYALYSPNYTSIEVMTLPDCKPVGGEPRSGNGFCPVEIWVPAYQETRRKGYTEEELQSYPKANWGWLSQDEIAREYDQDLWEPDAPVLFEEVALVTGCVWGDDSSWKLEVRDLSRASEGVLGTIQNWGYHPLWGSLRESVMLYSGSQIGNAPREYLSISFAEITSKSIFWKEDHQPFTGSDD